MSCAHRSGQNRRERRSSPANVSDGLVANMSSDGSKMEGAEIFKKYNQAVFMVFTTDGNSVYQGSGFFIASSPIVVPLKT